MRHARRPPLRTRMAEPVDPVPHRLAQHALSPRITILPRFATKPQVSVVGPAVKVRPTEHPDGVSSATLIAARNEFESFQIVCRAEPSQPMQDLTVTLDGPLAGPGNSNIPEANVTIYREDYYDVQAPSNMDGAPGPWPDILIPAIDPFVGEARNAFPIDVPAGENRVAWIDILVPTDAAPGVYQGSITTSWTTASAQAQTIPIQVTVLDATLPSTPTIKSAFGLSRNGPCFAANWGETCIDVTSEADGWRLHALYALAGLHNRITVSEPSYRVLGHHNLHLFEEYILPLLAGTAPTALAGARLTSIRADMGSALALWRDIALEHDFADRAFIYACDEPGTNPEIWAECTTAADASRQVWPEVATLVTASVQNIPDDHALDVVDWLVVLVNQMDDKPDSTQQEGRFRGNQRAAYDAFVNLDANNEVWLYSSCMSHGCESSWGDNGFCQVGPRPGAGKSITDPYFTGWPDYVIDAAASQARAMGWLVFLSDAVGELYFQIDHCLQSARSAQYAFGGNGDGTLIYHGDPEWIGGTTHIPVESIRLKQIRDGYEDFEYLKIVESMGFGDEAYRIASTLFPTMYTTIREQHAIDAARTELAHYIDPERVPEP